VNDGACSTARIDDPVDAGIADFLRGQIEAELLAHDPGEEPAHRVLLPTGCHHDGGNGCRCRDTARGWKLARSRCYEAVFRAALPSVQSQLGLETQWRGQGIGFAEITAFAS
jgi:hypothetical protein